MRGFEQSSAVYRFGSFRLEPASGQLIHDGRPVPLTPKTFDALLYLVQHSGQLVTKDDLMRALWTDAFVSESNLTQTIFMARKALAENGNEQSCITTVPGRGYRFDAEVQRELFNPSPPARPSATQAEGQVLPTVLLKPKFLDHPPILLAAIAAVFMTALAGYFLWWRPQHIAAVPANGKIMLAVLPLKNLTGDASEEYLVDGLTEEMITQLGNLDPQRLSVIARTSVMHYKSERVPANEVGRELGVQYVIEGSVRRDARNVRVTAQLIRTKDQTHVWAREYNRELKSLLSLQGEIAQEVADEIQLTLGNHKPPVSETAAAPREFEAYDLYLKGLYHFNKRTVPDLNEAIEYFQQVTAREPSFARAYVGIADSYALVSGYGMRPQTDAISKARAAALTALQIDPNLPEAHCALALIVQNYDWDWTTAEREFRRAVDLNPSNATAHHWYAEHLMWQGRFEEALQESERARQLDPLSLIIAADNGAIFYFARQYDRAIDEWRSVLEIVPNFPRAGLIGFAYVEKGMFREALASLEAHRPATDEPWYWSNRAIIYGRAGDNSEAHIALKKLLQLNQRETIDPKIIADASAALGEKDQALDWLEKAFAQHSNGLIALKVDPLYDPLREDPHFQSLVHRVGLDRRSAATTSASGRPRYAKFAVILLNPVWRMRQSRISR